VGGTGRGGAQGNADADGVGVGLGVEGDGDGDGRGRHGRRGRGLLELFGRAVQLMSTVCGDAAGGSMEMTALPAPGPRVTVTSSVTLCPAWSVPESLLRLTCAVEALADQETGPPAAVSVIWLLEPVPRAMLSGDTASVPVEAGVGGVGAVNCGYSGYCGAPGVGAGVLAGVSGWVTSVIIASPLPLAGLPKAGRGDGFS
jgi:hypothetical protein